MVTELSIPQANVKSPASRLNRLAMAIVLIIVLAVAFWLYLKAARDQGLLISIRFSAGHGLKVDDPVKLNDVTVGLVREVSITDDLAAVHVTIGLTGPPVSRDRIAREGSQFWIVRPDISLTRIRGSETLIGANYIEVEPGRGRPRRQFVGLADPPIVERRQAGDLELTLTSRQAGSATVGAPVLYRGLEVGRVLSIKLAPSGNEVLTSVLIRASYSGLVREGSRFFKLNAVEFDMGIKGITLTAGSLETMIKGGIGFATPGPSDQGGPVKKGRRFTLYTEAEEKWQAWEPSLNLAAATLLLTPHPVSCHLSWGKGNRFTKMFRADGQRNGAALPTTLGLLGPTELFRPNQAWSDPFVLEVAQMYLPSDSEHLWTGNGLTLLAYRSDGGIVWPPRFRVPDKPEDIMIYRTPEDSSFVSASELTVSEGHWHLPKSRLDASWHGASVIASADQNLIGILLVEGKEAKVATLPTDFPSSH
jgi:hypothetical protein